VQELLFLIGPKTDVYSLVKVMLEYGEIIRVRGC